MKVEIDQIKAKQNEHYRIQVVEEELINVQSILNIWQNM
jgi:hypothetical protein